MDYNSVPDYEKCRKILVSGVTSNGGLLTGPLQLTIKSVSPKRKSAAAGETPQKKSKVTRKKQKVEDSSDEDEQENIENENTTPLRSGRIRNVKSKNKTDDVPIKKSRSKKKEVEVISNSESENETNGFTAEMLRIKQKLEEKKKSKPRSKRVLSSQ